LLLKGDISERDLRDFKSEAIVMCKLRFFFKHYKMELKKYRPHVNVVQFLGITAAPQLCIVTEFLEQGSLFQYVFSDSKIDSTILMNIVKGIAAGEFNQTI
jgi:hypothetical protein